MPELERHARALALPDVPRQIKESRIIDGLEFAQYYAEASAVRLLTMARGKFKRDFNSLNELDYKRYLRLDLTPGEILEASADVLYKDVGDRDNIYLELSSQSTLGRINFVHYQLNRLTPYTTFTLVATDYMGIPLFSTHRQPLRSMKAGEFALVTDMTSAILKQGFTPNPDDLPSKT
jgi:hypothetical protein